MKNPAWTKSEDQRLTAARAMNMGWSQVATFLPGRTAYACCARHVDLERAAGTRAPRSPKPAPRTAAIVRPVEKAVELPQPWSEKGSSLLGCEALADATRALYRREAERRGASVEAVRIALNYSPDDIRAHMARAA